MRHNSNTQIFDLFVVDSNLSNYYDKKLRYFLPNVFSSQMKMRAFIFTIRTSEKRFKQQNRPRPKRVYPPKILIYFITDISLRVGPFCGTGKLG